MVIVLNEPTNCVDSTEPLRNERPPSHMAVIPEPPLEAAARGAPAVGHSELALSAAAAILLPDTQRSHEMDIDMEIAEPLIDPDAPEAIKTNLKLLFDEHYVRPERPEFPEVQDKLSLTLKEIQPFNRACPPLSVRYKSKLREILKNLCDRRIIRKSNSKFISPMDLIVIDDTPSLQIDYRCLNKYIDSEKHPLPNFKDHMIILGKNKKYFSMIELVDAHYHIEIEQDFIKYTSFMTPFGPYEFLRMPAGLKTEPAQFQRYMRAVLSELTDTEQLVVTMNGILVATETDEEHMYILKRVFQKFVRNNVVIAIDKSKFFHKEIEYYDHVISVDGVRPSTKGLEPIRQFPKPKNAGELIQYIKMCKYFKKFIKGFESIADPLNQLLNGLQKNQEFEFTDPQLEAFETLKHKLTSPPTLAIFNIEDETELHCDASKHGFGAVLLQRKDDNEMHPIFYFSQRTSPIEKNEYDPAQLELYAIRYAVTHFFTFLLGIEFKIVTDCKSVRDILIGDKPNSKVESKIRKLLQPLNYTVEHRTRDKMEHVDTLSRPVDPA